MSRQHDPWAMQLSSLMTRTDRVNGCLRRQALFREFEAAIDGQRVMGAPAMAFIVRAGIQILADHSRLYWKRDCTPGTEWFRFQSAVPTGRIWTAKDDSVTLPGWLGIPGMRHSIGCA